MYAKTHDYKMNFYKKDANNFNYFILYMINQIVYIYTQNYYIIIILYKIILKMNTLFICINY